MKIEVIGAGSFGLALARLLGLAGHEVSLWARSAAQRDELRTTRQCQAYLPGIVLPPKVSIADTPAGEADLAVLAVPSHAMRGVLESLPLKPGGIRLSVAKGIEVDTLQRMSEVIAACAPGGPVVALSGPSHAEEVGRDLPASLVAASADTAAAEAVQEAFRGPSMRVYTSDDVVGVELGGALKNVIAIAAGACEGLGLGDNAKAALVTRGLAEISRLGVACGADPLTFAGLSGMGDLIATCWSGHSRNRAVGEAVAKGETLDQILGRTTMVAEGVRTTRSAVALAQRAGVEMPICESVYEVLFNGAPPAVALAKLMMRESKPERA
ncbi:MAG: NAD(P)H-dependent glycerol-3-phosphate dehydrogenase [Candidatus Hydrogenedens sp.]|nr:NAD(P)H-dependent glycerol-3-phosphate dehydrogenase [Candidatus Hydrogenedens sp.]